MSLLKRVLKVASLRMLIRVIGLVLVLGAAIFLVRRGVPQHVSTPVGAPPTAPMAVVAALPPEETRTPVEYTSRGRRDPFRQSPQEPAQKEPEVNLKVTGIVYGPRYYYALVESRSEERRVGKECRL